MKTKKVMFVSLLAAMGICIVLWKCKKQPGSYDPGIKLHFNKINITWHGADRFTGGFPVLENTKLKYHSVHSVENDSVFIFEFLHNFEDHVEIKAVISPAGNSIIFYLSPNNFHTQKASDFVGILFEQLPEMVSGEVWQNGKYNAVTNTDLVKGKNGGFMLVKYKDGNYGCCLPLTGKGYKTSIGSFNDKFCLKGYHSLDGHNENDIPIAFIAFASDTQQLLNLLKREPLIKEEVRNTKFPF